jgi:amidase
MDKTNAPAAYVKDGETVIFETLDCFGGQLTSEDQKMGGLDWSDINPATGPLYVEGAKAGDVLKVEILTIELADHGVMIHSAGERVTGLSATGEVTKILPIENGCARFNDKLSFPLQPMIGVIGTAPAGEGIPTGTPGAHGGNMDCTRIGAGTTLYLPVNVDGALLAMGDMHAVMGDGEIGVSGLEIPGSVTLRLTVENRFYVPFPVVFNEDRVYAVASAETLDESCEKASENLYQFIVQVGGVPVEDAVALMTIAADLHVCQMVNQLRTACMSIPFKYCPMIRKFAGRVFVASLK